MRHVYHFVPRRCPSSNKIMYRNKAVAQQAADEGYLERGTRLWIYQCEYCGTWHLTHHPPLEPLEGPVWNGKKPRSRHRGYKPRRR